MFTLRPYLDRHDSHAPRERSDGAALIPGLDGLRGVAILMVFLIHAGLLPQGWCGVWLFFLISGYLITRNLLRTKGEPARTFFGRFYYRRALRILPLYGTYVVLLAALAQRLSRTEPVHSAIAAGLPYAATFTYNLWTVTRDFQHSYFLTHFWSLCFEEQFYLLWPLVVFLLPLCSLRRVILLLILLGPAIRAACGLLAGVGPLAPTTGRLNFYLPLAQMDAFAWGALLNFVRPAWPGRSVRVLWLCGGLLLCAGLWCSYLQHGSLHPGYVFPSEMQVARVDVWGYSLLDLFVFLLILHGTTPGTWLTRLLESPPLRRIGRVSYGMYVLHYGVIHLVSGCIPKVHALGKRAGSLWLAGVSLALTYGLASLSYRYLEEPFLLLKNRLFAARR